MTRHIRNMNQLQAALMPNMVNMVDILAERVYETLNHFLQEYYDSYDPRSYRRQFDFLRSAIKVEPKIKGNKVVASVYIDTDSMDNYDNVTGVQVASWANQGLHGGLDTGNNTPHVWDDAMERTVDDGSLLQLAVEYLRSRGISVRM